MKKDTFIKNFLLVSIVSMIYIVLYYSYNIEILNAKYLLLYIVIIQLFCIIKYRKNNIIFIISIFIITYYTPMLEFYFNGIKLTATDINFLGNADERTLILYCLFYLIFFIVLNISVDKGPNNTLKDKIKSVDNIILFYIAIAGISACILLGHKGMPIIGGYGKGNAASTILNEYIIIFFILAYIFSCNKTIRKYIIWILVLVYTIINFIYGDRISVLQTFILIFYLYLDKYLDYKGIIVLAIIFSIILNMVGELRSTGKIDMPFKKFDTNISENIDTNQSQVFNSSIAISNLVRDEILTYKDRINSFIQYIIRLVRKSSTMELSNLSLYSQKFYHAQGGGFIPIYFYVWFGVVGVILVAIIVALMFRWLKNIESNMYSIIALVILALFPRWLVYDPLIGIKMPIYMIIGYWTFHFMHNVLRKYIN